MPRLCATKWPWHTTGAEAKSERQYAPAVGLLPGRQGPRTIGSSRGPTPSCPTFAARLRHGRQDPGRFRFFTSRAGGRFGRSDAALKLDISSRRLRSQLLASAPLPGAAPPPPPARGRREHPRAPRRHPLRGRGRPPLPRPRTRGGDLLRRRVGLIRDGCADPVEADLDGVEQQVGEWVSGRG